ncbi:MAG TPA: endolytic transglycosylase MltG [Devosia sp.]
MSADRNEKRQRRRRRSGLVSVLNGFLTLLILGIVVVGGGLFWGANEFYAPGPKAEDVEFEVKKGSGLETVASALEDQNLVSNKLLFRAGTWALKKQSELKAGIFKIKANSSMADILTELTEGKPILLAVVVPEGWTSWQVADRLTNHPDLTGEATPTPEEGSILPGSYDYDRGMPRTEVLARMQAAMAEKLAAIFAGCDPTVCGENGVVRSPAELVTLASVVEKETGVATERPEVAAVFINRLKKGMRLQSDPTIIYGITKGVGKLDRPIRRSEIEAKTEYNTYQVDGLPAGPIANPGIESLEAVANPPASENLYFVAKTTDPRDGHLFAKTYAEHRKNVALYRKATNEAGAEAAKEALEDAEAAKDDAAEPAATPQ